MRPWKSFRKKTSKRRKARPKARSRNVASFTCRRPARMAGWSRVGLIERMVTVNLVALRKLDGENAQNLRRYVLGLALVAATEPLDGFLRQGCLLVQDEKAVAEWVAVARDGVRAPITLSSDVALDYAKAAAAAVRRRHRPPRRLQEGIGAGRFEGARQEEGQEDQGRGLIHALPPHLRAIPRRPLSRQRRVAAVARASVSSAGRGRGAREKPCASARWRRSNGSKAWARRRSLRQRPMSGQGFKNFVPNNDLDAVGGDPATDWRDSHGQDHPPALLSMPPFRCFMRGRSSKARTPSVMRERSARLPTISINSAAASTWPGRKARLSTKSRPRRGFAAMAASCGVPTKAERRSPFLPTARFSGEFDTSALRQTRKRFKTVGKGKKDPAAFLAGAKARLRSGSL